MTLNIKQAGIFIVIAYVGYLLGGYAVDWLAPFIPFLFTGIIGDAIRFIIPTAIVFIGWTRFGKG